MINRAKWFAVRKPSTGKIIAKSDCAAEILLRYKNVVLYSPDPPFSLWRRIWVQDHYYGD